MTDSDSYVTGFLHSFDLNQWLLIDKGFTLSKAGPQLKWTGVGGKIKGLDDWYLTEDYPRTLNTAGDYAPMQHWLDRGVPKSILASRTFEKPHIGMAREFHEETGYGVAAKRWHCFLIKEYKGCKIYCFACACSPDELLKVVYAQRKLPEGQVAIAQYPDICFTPWQYTFDLRYIIPMIILEHQKGMIMQLDPEGVNSEFQRSPH